MDFLNKSLAQLSELFRSMTPGARITAGLLLAVVVVSLGYLFRQGTAGPDAYLFGGQPLSDAELNKIDAALGQAGLSATREANRLRVPAGQQAAYMAAIADAEVLPDNFSTILEDAIGKGAWWGESLASTRERLKIAKQKALTEIIEAMPWVEQAMVLYDEQTSPGLSRVKQVTASVNVRPVVGETLSPTKVKRLQRLVARSVAGMKVEDVGITNLDDGGMYGADNELSFDIFENEYYRLKVAFETQQRERIINHLRDMIPGVRVEVNAEFDATKEEVTRNVKPDPTSAVLREVETKESATQSTGPAGGQPGAIAQGPNRQGSTAAPEPDKNVTNNSKSEIDNVVGVQESRILKDGYTLKAVHATVLLPSSYIESVWKSSNPTATAPPTPADLKTVESDVKTTVESVVEPLLLVQANMGQNTYKYVRVHVLPSPPVPTIELPSTASQAVGWVGRYWSTLAMLGVAMFSLLVMRSVVKGGPSSAPATAGASGSTLAIDADEPSSQSDNAAEEPADDRPRLRLKRGKSLKDDLVEIVHEDPDAAAEILRSWIGKVA
jgi:flagellar M-ring protein FliF